MRFFCSAFLFDPTLGLTQDLLRLLYSDHTLAETFLGECTADPFLRKTHYVREASTIFALWDLRHALCLRCNAFFSARQPRP